MYFLNGKKIQYKRGYVMLCVCYLIDCNLTLENMANKRKRQKERDGKKMKIETREKTKKKREE